MSEHGTDPAVEVAEARSELEATLWVDALRAAGIQARSFPRGVQGAFGGSASLTSSHVVVVPASRLEEAEAVIAGLAGEEALSATGGAGRFIDRPFLIVVLVLVLAGLVAIALGSFR